MSERDGLTSSSADLTSISMDHVLPIAEVATCGDLCPVDKTGLGVKLKDLPERIDTIWIACCRGDGAPTACVNAQLMK